MKVNREIAVAWFAAHGLEAVAEFRFDEKRRWRSDFYFAPDILLEVEGGVWSGGRHTSPKGFLKDMEKYNRAAVLGYRILRTTPDEVCMQETIDMVKAAIKSPVLYLPEKG
jgi:hypothetical protein